MDFKTSIRIFAVLAGNLKGSIASMSLKTFVRRTDGYLFDLVVPTHERYAQNDKTKPSHVQMTIASWTLKTSPSTYSLSEWANM
jgi:hypothetical protein